MIRTSRTVLLALVLASVSGCNLSGEDGIDGSGEIVTETRVVSGFTSLEFRTEGSITLVQGLDEGVTIETDANLMQYLDVRVEGGTLVIENTESGIDLEPSDSIEWTVSFIGLARIELTGAGDLNAASLDTDSLDIVVPGAMNVAVGALTVRELGIELSGAGNVDVLGSADSLTVELSGAGTIDTGGLAATEATVRLSGAGDVTVWATDSLDASISGAGGVEYFGEPGRLITDVTGTGTIEPAG